MARTQQVGGSAIMRSSCTIFLLVLLSRNNVVRAQDPCSICPPEQVVTLPDVIIPEGFAFVLQADTSCADLEAQAQNGDFLDTACALLRSYGVGADCGCSEETAPTAPATAVPETPAPAVPETPAPTVAETQAPAVPETPVPTIAETQAPAVPETPEPTVPETPAPAVAETPAPVVAETPAPVTPAPVEPLTPAPVTEAPVTEPSTSPAPTGEDDTPAPTSVPPPPGTVMGEILISLSPVMSDLTNSATAGLEESCSKFYVANQNTVENPVCTVLSSELVSRRLRSLQGGSTLNVVTSITGMGLVEDSDEFEASLVSVLNDNAEEFVSMLKTTGDSESQQFFSSVESVTASETVGELPGPPTSSPGSDGDGDDGLSGGAKFGIALAVIVAVGGVGYFIWKTEKEKDEHGEDGGGGGESGNDKDRPSSIEVTSAAAAGAATATKEEEVKQPTGEIVEGMGTVMTSGEETKSVPPPSLEVVEVLAPAGKLGIVLDTTVEGPMVNRVKEGSAMTGKLFSGDLIVQINDEDTRAMNAAAINAIMIKTANAERTLKIKRASKADATEVAVAAAAGAAGAAAAALTKKSSSDPDAPVKDSTSVVQDSTSAVKGDSTSVVKDSTSVVADSKSVGVAAAAGAAVAAAASDEKKKKPEVKKSAAEPTKSSMKEESSSTEAKKGAAVGATAAAASAKKSAKRSISAELKATMKEHEIKAPAGKMGIVIDTTLEGPMIHSVKPDGPLAGKIFAGDIITKINGEETKALNSTAINSIMVKTSGAERLLTVLRAPGVGKVAVAPAPKPAAEPVTALPKTEEPPADEEIDSDELSEA